MVEKAGEVDENSRDHRGVNRAGDCSRHNRGVPKAIIDMGSNWDDGLSSRHGSRAGWIDLRSLAEPDLDTNGADSIIAPHRLVPHAQNPFHRFASVTPITADSEKSHLLHSGDETLHVCPAHGPFAGDPNLRTGASGAGMLR